MGSMLLFVFGLNWLALGWDLIIGATVIVILLALWRIVPRREE